MAENILQTLARGAVATLKGVGQVIGELATAYLQMMDRELPPNWRSLTIPQVQAIAMLMADEGWSLAWAPPAEVVLQLLDEPTREGREQLLMDAEGPICEELARLMAQMPATPLTAMREGCQQAVDAYLAGQFVAAQATATVALAHAVHEHLDYDGLDVARRDLRQLDPEGCLPHLYRRVAVRAALRTAIKGANAKSVHKPAQRYNRNASAHRLDPGQYRQVNSLVGVMLAVSVLVDLDLHLREADDGALGSLPDGGASLPPSLRVALQRPKA